MTQIRFDLGDLFPSDSKYITESLLIFERNAEAFLNDSFITVEYLYTSLLRDFAPVLKVTINKDMQIQVNELTEKQAKKLAAFGACIKTLIQCENVPEKWKDMMFLHLKNFSRGMCGMCGEDLCFSW